MEVMPGYKQTEIGVIPEDWDVVPLSSHCLLRSRLNTRWPATIFCIVSLPWFAKESLERFTSPNAVQELHSHGTPDGIPSTKMPSYRLSSITTSRGGVLEST